MDEVFQPPTQIQEFLSQKKSGANPSIIVVAARVDIPPYFSLVGGLSRSHESLCRRPQMDDKNTFNILRPFIFFWCSA